MLAVRLAVPLAVFLSCACVAELPGCAPRRSVAEDVGQTASVVLLPPSLPFFCPALKGLLCHSEIKLFVFYHKLLKSGKNKGFWAEQSNSSQFSAGSFFFFNLKIFSFSEPPFVKRKKWSFPGEKVNVRCLGSTHPCAAGRQLLREHFLYSGHRCLS